ncbi:SRPBCC family protein [Flexivirga oryzae]|uniref:Putative membrane protein n=1 Tax=Flexivirga oryzae TaxID=1794944 RepID=A0A839NAS7_9MICO|nr:SRPBCC family protein [Flexivirga oryzae]MBB2893939.1 putative membrane protein [Flexivirga oryzae]
MNRHFRFASRHQLAAPRDAVFDVLVDAERWPTWWPQIRSVIPYDDTHGRAEIRSVLPFTLRIELTSEIADRESGVLRASLTGDLVGWSEFVIHAAGQGTALEYSQEVDLRLSGQLGRVACSAPARPLLIANHALMIRRGMHGLQRAAAG